MALRRRSAATSARSAWSCSIHCPGSRKLVTPFASCRNASFGSFSTWKCRSISPGISVRPARSSRSAPSGTSPFPLGCTLSMRSPLMVTRMSFCAASPVPSMTARGPGPAFARCSGEGCRAEAPKARRRADSLRNELRLGRPGSPAAGRERRLPRHTAATMRAASARMRARWRTSFRDGIS